MNIEKREIVTAVVSAVAGSAVTFLVTFSSVSYFFGGLDERVQTNSRDIREVTQAIREQRQSVEALEKSTAALEKSTAENLNAIRELRKSTEDNLNAIREQKQSIENAEFSIDDLKRLVAELATIQVHDEYPWSSETEKRVREIVRELHKRSQ